MTNNEPTVYIVDDEKSVCRAIRNLVESVGLRARAFTRAAQFLETYDSSRPGCLVLDIRIPEISGLKLFEILRQRKIGIPTIFITGFSTVTQAVRAMKMGAFDFIEKPFDDQFLLDRIQEALRQDREVRRDQEKKREYARRMARLSERERQILNGVIAGKNNKQIALEYAISHKTVEYHRTNIMRKLKADTLVELTKIVLLTSVEE